VRGRGVAAIGDPSTISIGNTLKIVLCQRFLLEILWARSQEFPMEIVAHKTISMMEICGHNTISIGNNFGRYRKIFFPKLPKKPRGTPENLRPRFPGWKFVDKETGFR
jgi:hypothetical protein